ncbi:hypothetical protein GYMLUDRAFT_68805 [Collybiopsis luxurians FD-317 M1]|nr:hypothetical protein GYMLUDRAFT_68805 [Collybiopsis luxurians FD-317 M1]
MSLFMLYERWLDIGFSARFSLPFSTVKDCPTRPSTTRRLSSWEVPLVNSVPHDLACKTENGSEDPTSATLCVRESRDVLFADLHEAEFKKSESVMVSSEYDFKDEVFEVSDEEVYEVSNDNQPEFDPALDNEILYHYNMNKEMLVLDSTTPWLTPHIVITPASDTVADLAVAWYNQPNFQDAEKLHLPPPEFSENPPSTYASPSSTIAPPRPCPMAVFSPSRFNAMIENCSDERLNYFNVVVALRRQTAKVVALMASRAAMSYRVRYDVALPFDDIERPFLWSDPAEPILLASRMHRATLIIDSPNPFRVPHIIINQPPPEDQWTTASNVLNDPQDYGYGRYLVVHARGISYINEPEDAYPEYMELDGGEAGAYDNTIDENFVPEQDEDYGDSYYSTLESYGSFEEPPELDTDSLSSLESPLPETPDTMDDEDFKTAFERALEKRALSVSSSISASEASHPNDSLEHPTFPPDDTLDGPTYSSFDDRPEPKDSFSSWADEDEDLPPIDDEWYQSVIRRTQQSATTA